MAFRTMLAMDDLRHNTTLTGLGVSPELQDCEVQFPLETSNFLA